jgi:hypothetical protein
MSTFITYFSSICQSDFKYQLSKAKRYPAGLSAGAHIAHGWL